MDRKTTGIKTVRAFNIPDLILYNETERDWMDFQEFSRSIELVYIYN